MRTGGGVFFCYPASLEPRLSFASLLSCLADAPGGSIRVSRSGSGTLARLATGLVDDYSAEGKMLGHIIMGVEQIGRAAKEVDLDAETTLLLQHMVLSHHNQPEFGSPRYPMFIEAEMLHHLDVLDARMDDFAQAQSCIEPGSFSEPVFHLDKRRIYRPAMTQE